MTDVRILYVLKRYPRLSETFIVNEIRALERLDVRIGIVSLMQPEPGERHGMVGDVQASAAYMPSGSVALASAAIAAHAAALFTNPAGYLRAFWAAAAWTKDSQKPLSLWKHFLRAGFVAATVREGKYAWIHAHFAHGPATVAHLASKMTGVPFSFTAHAKDLYLTRPRTLARRIAAAAFVATCTRYNAEYIGAHVKRQDLTKIALVYHGIDLPPFQALAQRRAARNADRFNILSVGRLVEKKGTADVIRACALLRDRGLAFTCTIVGSGPMRQSLQALIDEFSLHNHVVLAGAMPHERLAALFESADAFVLASAIAEDGDRDGIPNVLVEAAAARVPIITTSVSGIPELIDHGNTGLLVEPHAPAMLADAICETLNSPHATAARAEAAATFVDAHFNVWRNAALLAALFRSYEVVL